MFKCGICGKEFVQVKDRAEHEQNCIKSYIEKSESIFDKVIHNLDKNYRIMDYEFKNIKTNEVIPITEKTIINTFEIAIGLMTLYNSQNGLTWILEEKSKEIKQ